jgi:hypothetical protein
MAHKRPWERNLEIDPPWVMNSQETTIQDFERMHSNGHATGVDLDYIRSQIDDLLKSSSARNSLTSAEIPSNHGDSVAEFYAAQNNGSVWGILEDHLDDVIDRFEVPIQAVSRALSYVGNATGMVSNTLEDSLAYAINKLEVPAHIMKEYVSAAGSAIAEAYSAVPAPARAGALTSLFAFLIACSPGSGNTTLVPTPSPENTKPVAEATVRPAEKPAATEEPREEPTVESKPTYEPPEPEPTAKPAIFSVSELPDYQNGIVTAKVTNIGEESGNLFAKLYDPATYNPKDHSTFLGIEELTLADGGAHEFKFDVSQLSRGKNYDNLKVEFFNPTTKRIQTFDVEKFYIPALASLQIDKNFDPENVYNDKDKKFTIPIRNFNGNEDLSAKDVTVELYSQSKLIGSCNVDQISPNSLPIEAIIEGILPSGTHEVAARFIYDDGSGQTRTYTSDPFTVNVPFPPTATPSPTATATPTSGPTAEPEPDPTSQPIPEPTPEPNNSYDFAKSLGLEADYLRELHFDGNAKEFISYLSSLPTFMRDIAERSGLVKKLDDKQTVAGLVDDGQINSDEVGYFKRVMESYQKEVEAMKPWLKQIPEQESLEALALNLSNFRRVGNDEMFYSLDNDALPSLLPKDLFVVDGIERKYAAEVIDPDGWGRTVKPYASAMVKNVNNFDSIHAKAWEVADDPSYKPRGQSVEDILHQGYFEAEAVGSTDNGVNAFEDIKLLVESGSDGAKAVLRLYATNLGNDTKNRDRGNWSGTEQARVELTGIDTWSLGIYAPEVMIVGHDVPAIPITDDDIRLLKGRSLDPLLIVDIDDKHYLPLQWTRNNILREDVNVITVYIGTGANDVKISNLKPY